MNYLSARNLPPVPHSIYCCTVFVQPEVNDDFIKMLWKIGNKEKIFQPSLEDGGREIALCKYGQIFSCEPSSFPIYLVDRVDAILTVYSCLLVALYTS